jgi:hypothetical protein
MGRAIPMVDRLHGCGCRDATSIEGPGAIFTALCARDAQEPGRVSRQYGPKDLVLFMLSMSRLSSMPLLCSADRVAKDQSSDGCPAIPEDRTGALVFGEQYQSFIDCVRGHSRTASVCSTWEVRRKVPISNVQRLSTVVNAAMTLPAEIEFPDSMK